MNHYIVLSFTVFFSAAFFFSTAQEASTQPPEETAGVQSLPGPSFEENMSLEEAIQKRRSVRSFAQKDLSREKLGQLLFAAQGITEPVQGFRTAPSAGATYPLEVFAATPTGIYHYIPEEHALAEISSADVRDDLAETAHEQSFIADAGVIIILAAVMERTTNRYGDRGVQYISMEAGHAAQNLLLQAVSLGLGAVPVGAIRDDAAVLEIIGGDKTMEPLYIIPVGYPEE
ncbi:MAG: SagB/ThcOx family dehydrogenase [Fibrobacterota bacterium]